MVNLPSVFFVVVVLICFCSVLSCLFLFIYLFICLFFFGGGGGVRIPVHFTHKRLQGFSVLWKKFRFQLRTFGVTGGGGGGGL